MLTADDIKKITDAQIEAQKELFYTKPELDGKFSTLQSSIDAVYKDKQTKDQEMTVLNHRMKQAEDVLDEAASKLGLQYEH